MKLHKMYDPITASPFICNESYMEIRPCKELEPYIKCFWGSKKPYRKDQTGIQLPELIIPDTCMDIIFDINYTDNIIDSSFCGIDEKSFTAQNNNSGELVSTFAVRFYPWSVYLFAEDSLKNTRNTAVDLEYHFSEFKRELEPLLFEAADIKERIQTAENYLTEHIHLERMNDVLMNSLTEIIKNNGNLEINKLAVNQHISTRQLERIFNEYIGIAPKKFSSLIRYQRLWQDILYKPDFQILDAVFQYGYTDQAHLLHDFRRFHTMTVPEARCYALEHVAFIQER